jgi:hypothetical protein
MALPPKPHETVMKLAAQLKPRAAGESVKKHTEADADWLAVATAADVPELVSLRGYLGAAIEHPKGSGRKWRYLYLDLELREWLLVEDDGIKETAAITDFGSPTEKCDIIWVKASSLVSKGSGSAAPEDRFLTGEFTHAGDFEWTPGGGYGGGTTGVFCDVRSPLCACYGRSRPRRPYPAAARN